MLSRRIYKRQSICPPRKQAAESFWESYFKHTLVNVEWMSASHDKGENDDVEKEQDDEADDFIIVIIIILIISNEPLVIFILLLLFIIIIIYHFHHHHHHHHNYLHRFYYITGLLLHYRSIYYIAVRLLHYRSIITLLVATIDRQSNKSTGNVIETMKMVMMTMINGNNDDGE